MSDITEILLMHDLMEADVGEDDYICVMALNSWLMKCVKGQLVLLSEHAGGTKAMSSPVWGGAFNYLDLKVFLAVLWGLPWKRPQNVIVMFQRDDDDSWNYAHQLSSEGGE